jgi:hypothetical protein
MHVTMSDFFLFVVIVVLMISAGCSESADPRLFHTSIGYNLHIQTNEQISNMTCYIPLPVKNGMPMMGEIELTPGIFEKNNVSAEFVESPPGMDLMGLYTLPNNSPVWLKIQSDHLNPDTPQHIQYDIELSNRTAEKSPLMFSDTVNPLGNQSVFLPKIHFASPVVVKITPTHPYWIQYTTIKSPQQIPVYAEYSASPSTHVEIFSKIGLSNTWKEEYDNYVWNDYDDYFDWQHTGPSQGWQIANGEFTAAEGIYPNLSDPLWQNVLNASAIG